MLEESKKGVVRTQSPAACHLALILVSPQQKVNMMKQ